MCFSATASFIAGAGLSAAGAITLREAKTRDRMPLAALPLLFGIQQLVEGVVWASTGHPLIRTSAALVYVMFAYVLWPTMVPLAVMAIEPRGRRKSILKGFVVFGAAMSLWLFWFIQSGPVTVSEVQHCMTYVVNVPPLPYGLAAYVFVTCFSCFFSRYPYVRVFGLALMGSLVIALFAYRQAFYSVWCFFAAILSLIIYAHLRQGHLVPTVAELKKMKPHL